MDENVPLAFAEKNVRPSLTRIASSAPLARIVLPVEVVPPPLTLSDGAVVPTIREIPLLNAEDTPIGAEAFLCEKGGWGMRDDAACPPPSAAGPSWEETRALARSPRSPLGTTLEIAAIGDSACAREGSASVLRGASRNEGAATDRRGECEITYDSVSLKPSMTSDALDSARALEPSAVTPSRSTGHGYLRPFTSLLLLELCL